MSVIQWNELIVLHTMSVMVSLLIVCDCTYLDLCFDKLVVLL